MKDSLHKINQAGWEQEPPQPGFLFGGVPTSYSILVCMAKLFFRMGSMNSGKSTALLQVAFNYEERDMTVSLIKPKADTKAGTKISSRIGLERDVDLLVPPTMNLKTFFLEEIELNRKPNCIIVDEAQFLTAEQVDQLFWLTVKQNIPVIAYGLRTDFLTDAFEGSRRLLEIAHSVEEIKTICWCGKKAIFNARKDSNGEWLTSEDDGVIAIDDGTGITYESLCGECYINFVNDFTEKN